jgi:hypothetical protein
MATGNIRVTLERLPAIAADDRFKLSTLRGL